LEVITTFSSTKSILGVCLGHQAITQAFGGKLINLDTVYHGVSTPCTVVKSNAVLLYGMEKNFEIGRYHSWAADKNTFPAVLDITATDEFGEIMALQHKTLDIHGVQFHPESILTPNGKIIMKNFLNS
jgi:anthranilate synthase component 2